jgi:hypothetical protein
MFDGNKYYMFTYAQRDGKYYINKGKLNLHLSIALNVKPWPKLKLKTWSNKGVMALCNKI